MFYSSILLLLTIVLLSGCADVGYHQPVYIISDSTQEEEQEQAHEESEVSKER